MIAVFSTDRGWRQPVEAALRERGHEVRGASRPAELAKCLGDGRVRLVVAGPLAGEVEAAQRTAGRCPVISPTPDDTMERIVHRAEGVLGGD
ncbi:hypothetical protein [Gemmatimonas sp.]|jgi:hypothetical protein|uniref:hypothetical protein n=1 Tax=Gemmatimonas sp. TaxID=1962908 RepID=UPI0037C0D26A